MEDDGKEQQLRRASTCAKFGDGPLRWHWKEGAVAEAASSLFDGTAMQLQGGCIVKRPQITESLW